LQALYEIGAESDLRRMFHVVMKLPRSSSLTRCIPHFAITMALLSFAFGQSATKQASQNNKSEQEVRQAIEKYRTALLHRDIPALERIWADDYVFVNASGEILTKAQRLENAKSGSTTLDSINEEENITVRVYQNSAVATSRVTIKGQSAVNLRVVSTATPTFGVKGPAGWQLVSNQLTTLAPK
jgi:ketosteroid isomerase-like protein